jgi:hypothetical protein
MRTACLMTTALLTFGCVAAPSARAAYTITFTESGGNVLESGSGSFDLVLLQRYWLTMRGGGGELSRLTAHAALSNKSAMTTAWPRIS